MTEKVYMTEKVDKDYSYRVVVFPIKIDNKDDDVDEMGKSTKNNSKDRRLSFSKESQF